MKINELRQKVKAEKSLRKVEVVLIELNSFDELTNYAFNMGLLYIATLLKQHNFKVKCLGVMDIFYTPAAELETWFKQAQPVLAGFYTISDNIFQVKAMAARLKQWLPKIIIAAGGPLATVEGEKMLQNTPFDIIGLGEGEAIMLQLAQYYIRGEGSLEEIEGIIYKRQAQASVSNQQSAVTMVRNPGFGWVKDLDALPFPDFDLVNYKKHFYLVSGRGCPYNCAFCFQGVHGKQYRYRSPQSVVQEVIFNLNKYGFKTFNFIDDTFIANPKRAKEIAAALQAYREQGHNFIFFCEGRIDILARNPELLSSLKQAGLARLQVGIESGSQRVLDLYNKHLTLKDIEKVVRQVQALKGISMHSNFILGGPETKEEFQASLDLAKNLLRLAPGWFECTPVFLCPYPATQIALNPEKFGIEILDPYFLTGTTVRTIFHRTQSAEPIDLYRWDKEFNQEVKAAMLELAPQLPFATVAQHFKWASYGMYSYWYQLIFPYAPILKDYFSYRLSPNFKRLEAIPLEDLNNWYPLRILKIKEYDKQGRLVLSGFYHNLYLCDPLELYIYDLSSGKLTLKEIIELVQDKTGGEIETILKELLLPFYHKLEDHYQIIFYH
jgi:anaerobic magnesium-protoporphyrin IX monomethyl ester cyclase